LPTAASGPPTLFNSKKAQAPIVPSSDAGIRDRKAALRGAARADRDALQSGLGAASATGLVARFHNTPALRALMAPSNIFAGYMPIGSELDCLPLLNRLVTADVPLCLPVVTAPDQPLIFRRWSPDDPLVPGTFGTSEPSAAAPEVSPQVLLVPMLAFDRQGNRLGYGGGYYDRTLKALRAASDGGGEIVAIGVAFAGQLRDKVPVSEGDEPLDWILTEISATCIADGSAGPRLV
jgi:5-formyltetrahydrofolate cyclo-ligase